MEKVIFDCDNTMGLPTKEIDDGLTLYYLLGRLEIDLQDYKEMIFPFCAEQVSGIKRQRRQPIIWLRWLPNTRKRSPCWLPVLLEICGGHLKLIPNFLQT
jgi:hypothetical protein